VIGSLIWTFSRHYNAREAAPTHFVDLLPSDDADCNDRVRAALTFEPWFRAGRDLSAMVETIPAVIWTYIEGLKRHDLAGISETVSDDLAFVTATSRLTKDQFLQMLRALYAGFPDWHYDHDPPELRDTTVAVRWQQGGTHTGTFTLPGMAPVSATGRTVTIPAQYFFYQVREGRIVEIRPEAIPGGAPRGILEQIGVGFPPL
jgi:predicted ester cyclase